MESPLSFDPSVLPDVMHEGSTEDFRWPLYFFDKVLPHSVEILPWQEEMNAALADLAAHDLIAPSGSDYRLTTNGFAFAAGFRHHLTKIGLRFTSQNAADVEAHEALLLVRSPHDLHLLDVGGKESALASLTLADARKLLEGMLRIGPAETESSAQASPPASKRTCTVCGARFGMEENVCPTCGTPAHVESAPLPAAAPHAVVAPPPLPQAPPAPTLPLCKKCGKPLAKATSKFCGSCGTPVS